MDKYQRRGGGGATTAVYKKPVAAAYGDAFESEPRFAAPFSPCLVDYAEIFGDVVDSYSIPFLALLPALDGHDAGTLGNHNAGFDYSEVFEGLDFEELVALYKELFVESRKDECPNTNRRCGFGDKRSENYYGLVDQQKQHLGSNPAPASNRSSSLWVWNPKVDSQIGKLLKSSFCGQ